MVAFGTPVAGAGLNVDTVSFFCTVAAVLILTFLASDLIAFYVEKMIPEPPVSRLGSSRRVDPSKTRAMNDYQVILTRNLFQ